MRNLTICFFAIGLTFVGVDGAWGQEKESEERTGSDEEKYHSALEEAKLRGAVAPEDVTDLATDGTIVITERGFINAQRLPRAEGTKPNE